MGNKFNVDNETTMLDEFLKATSGDIRRVYDEKNTYVSSYSDLPKNCLKLIQKQNIPEDVVINGSNLAILCRLLSYEMRRNIIYTGSKRMSKDETKNLINDENKENMKENLRIQTMRSSINLNNNNSTFKKINAPLLKNKSEKQLIQKDVEWNLPIGVLGMIFQYCKYSDYKSITNVCKKWRKIYFQTMSRKYEDSISIFTNKKGSFGKFYSLQELIVTEKKNFSAYTVKDNNDKSICRVDIITMDNHKKRFYKLLKKIHFSKVMDHPFFPKIKDLFNTFSTFKIVTDTKPNINLIDLNRSAKLEESEIAYIVKSILLGIQHAHSKEILVRSLSMKNLYINTSGEVQLLELGGAVYSKQSKEENEESSIQGNAFFASPEMISGSYGYKSDIYAIGLICLYLLGQKLSGGKHRMSSLFKTGCQIFYKYPTDRSDTAISFLNASLNPNCNERASIDQLLSHPFIALEKKNSKSSMESLVNQLIHPINFNKAIDNF